MTTNFGELLSAKPAEAEKPKPLPAGPYLCLVQKYEMGESREKKTPFVRFTFKPLQARDGVDPEQLSAVGDFSERTLRKDFYLTKDAMWRFADFLQDRGLKIDVGQRTYAMVLPETAGKQIVAVVKQAPSSKPGDDSIFNEIESFQAVE